MAFQPHGNQEAQNRKQILQDLHERKRQMINQQGGAANSGSSAGTSHVTRPTQDSLIVRNPNEIHQLAVNQRQALEHANTVSPGCYITQDSLFGNLILPVIPRLENEG